MKGIELYSSDKSWLKTQKIIKKDGADLLFLHLDGFVSLKGLAITKMEAIRIHQFHGKKVAKHTTEQHLKERYSKAKL